MTNSKRYKLLINRIKFLDNNILPVISVTGDYSDIDKDYTRSYVLLAHAEIESFLEERVSEKVEKAIQNWISNRKRSNCLKAILAFESSNINFEKKSLAERQSMESRIRHVVNHFRFVIKGNHGIKKDNILKLLLPIGIEIDDVDDAWLTTMDSFGSKRGDIAHNSVSLIQTPIDPLTEKNLINNIIIPELAKIDLLITGIS